jgi:hypothetical protein
MDLTRLFEHYAALGLYGCENCMSAREKTKAMWGEMVRKIFKSKKDNNKRAYKIK